MYVPLRRGQQQQRRHFISARAVASCLWQVPAGAYYVRCLYAAWTPNRHACLWGDCLGYPFKTPPAAMPPARPQPECRWNGSVRRPPACSAGVCREGGAAAGVRAERHKVLRYGGAGALPSAGSTPHPYIRTSALAAQVPHVYRKCQQHPTGLVSPTSSTAYRNAMCSSQPLRHTCAPAPHPTCMVASSSDRLDSLLPAASSCCCSVASASCLEEASDWVASI